MSEMSQPNERNRTGEGSGPVAADLRAVLSSIGETVYTWNIDTDRIDWGGNATVTLKAPGGTAIASGRAFARLVVADSGLSRYDAVMRSSQRDVGHGVPFQTSYAFKAPSGETLWLEDTGRWFGGIDGRPGRVHGVVRIVPQPAAGKGGRSGQCDELTGGLTRQQLSDLLADEIVRCRREHKTLALALIGIDGLGGLNEAYGFDVADEVIAAIAERLRSVMRRGDTLARYSGNKLGVALLGCSEEQLPVAAVRFAEAVKAAPVETTAGSVHANVVIGAVLLPRFGPTAALAMQHAEEALADAKASPARAYVAYAPDRRRDERRQSNRRFTDEIVTALNERRVVLARQPIVASHSREIAFYEALVRVHRADGTLMPASQIVPLIEKLGFVQLLDHRVLELAVAALAEDPALSLSMNVSSATAHHPDWIAALGGHLAAQPGLAQRLIVELTETCAIEDLEATQRSIAATRALGVRVAIDDFGSGHTSFRHLRDLNVDLVKIDGAFVQNLGRSTDDRFFVRTLVDLARHLGVGIVAEWVQDEETARMLEGWGIEYLQGELFGEASTPVPPVSVAV